MQQTQSKHVPLFHPPVRVFIENEHNISDAHIKIIMYLITSSLK